MQKTNRLRYATNQPPWTNEKVDRILKEGGAISFNGVTDKLKKPADHKRASAQRHLKKNSGHEIVIIGIPIAWQSLFSGC